MSRRPTSRAGIRRPPRDARRRSRRRRGPRDVVLEVLAAVRERDAYANLLLPDAISRAGLDRRDAGLATELCYGTLRALGTLDWIVSLHSDRPLSRVEPAVLDRLRLGVYQLVYTSVPPYAAVTETVETTTSAGARGFVNAILRRVATGKDQIPWPSPDGDPVSYLEIVYAHPRWIVEMWLDELGRAETEALVRVNNRPPAIGIRVNTTQTSPEALTERFVAVGIEVEPARWSPEALVVRGAGEPRRWPGWEEGAFAVQDEASVLTVEALAPQPGELVVDLCAGPGGKTAHLAHRSGRVVAVELHEHRARMVRDGVDRLVVAPTSSVLVVRADGTRPPLRGGADAVLVDAPCTGLGVLRRRPEARWRVGPSDIDELAGAQLALLRAGFGLLGEGGRLVYAVCTISSKETLEVVERFRRHEPGAEPAEVLPEIPGTGAHGPGMLQLLPHVHGTDGMFIAAFRKS